MSFGFDFCSCSSRIVVTQVLSFVKIGDLDPIAEMFILNETSARIFAVVFAFLRTQARREHMDGIESQV